MHVPMSTKISLSIVLLSHFILHCDVHAIIKVLVRYRTNAASGSVAVGGVRIISALSQAVYVREK